MAKKGKSTGSTKEGKQRRLQVNDRVLILGGAFRGRKGKILSINGRSRAEVKIQGVKDAPHLYLNQLQRT